MESPGDGKSTLAQGGGGAGGGTAIQMEELLQVKEVFDPFENDQGVDEETFVQGMGAIFDYMEEDHVRLWFHHIDVTARGTITWREFVRHLMLENVDEKAENQERQYSADPDQNGAQLGWPHKAQVTRVLTSRLGQVITTCEEGVIKVWNSKQFKLQHTVTQSNASHISDATLMRNDNMLVTTSFDRVVTVYTCLNWLPIRRYIGAKKWTDVLAKHTAIQSDQKRENSLNSVECVLMPDVLHPISSVECVNRDRGEAEQAYMLLGLQNGCVHLYPLSNLNKHTYAATKASAYPEKKYTHHDDSISRILWCDVVQGFITASWDRKLQITELESGRRLRSLTNDGHEKSVFWCDYSPSRKVIASCGADKDILLWNPYMDHSIMRLSGHLSSVTMVAFNAEDQQLISLGSDQAIKLWDLRTQRVFQTIAEKQHQPHQFPLSSMTFDKTNQRIVLASSFPQAFVLRKSLFTQGAIYTGHNETLIGAAYNPDFDQVISVDTRSAIVWDCNTGERLTCFYLSQDNVTTFRFDVSKRRLLIGSQNGDVSMWNFICGQQLKRMKVESNDEVNMLRHIARDAQRQKYTIGISGQNVTFWTDTEGIVDPLHKTIKTGRDIVCMEYCPPLTIAVGCSDGVIIFFNMNSFQQTFQLKRGKMKKSFWDEEGEPDGEKLTARAFNPNSKWIDNSVESMVFLAKQQILVSVNGDEYIHFWDCRNGQLLLMYDAKYYKDQAMFILATDAANDYLFVCDDQGHIFIYDISRLADGEGGETEKAYTKLSITPSMINLVHSFQAHKSSVLSIEYIDKRRLLLTTCGDASSIALWTLAGEPVGQFGQPKLWDLDDETTFGKGPKVEKISNREKLKIVKYPISKVGMLLKAHAKLRRGSRMMTAEEMNPQKGDGEELTEDKTQEQWEESSETANQEESTSFITDLLLPGINNLPKGPLVNKTHVRQSPQMDTQSGLGSDGVELKLPQLAGKHHLHVTKYQSSPRTSSMRPDITFVKNSSLAREEIRPDRKQGAVVTMGRDGEVCAVATEEEETEVEALQSSVGEGAHTHTLGENSFLDAEPEAGVVKYDPHAHSRRWFGRIAERLLQCSTDKQDSIRGSMNTGLAALDTLRVAPIQDSEEEVDESLNISKIEVVFEEAEESSNTGTPFGLPQALTDAIKADGEDAAAETTAADANPVVKLDMEAAAEEKDKGAEEDEKEDKKDSKDEPKKDNKKRPPPKPVRWQGRPASLLPLQKLASVAHPSKQWSPTVRKLASKPAGKPAFHVFK